ncbi:MAG: hypothetical protein ACKOKC_17520 [Chthoniobacterales bacterium]
MMPPILMPTAPKYAPLAKWTRGQINRFWPDHPDIFLCGTPDSDLPLREDPRDWMRVVCSACADLQERGENQVYLILDDHPPIAPCNSSFLRETLPRMACELNATSIVTGGFGPLIRPKTDITNWEGWRVECLPADEPWKLPLHPALWNLERLRGILETLILRLPEEQHTPWAFERIGSDRQKSGLPEEWLSSCWRLDARQTSSPETAALHDVSDRISRGSRRLASVFKRVMGVGPSTDPLRSPRIGPYPCFWSGVMKKGRLNTDYMNYALIKKRAELMEGLEASFAACDV